MGTRNARVANVRRSALGAVGLKGEACAAIDGTLEHIGQGLNRDVYVNATYTIVYKVVGGRANHPRDYNALNESEFESMCNLRNDRETHKYHTPLTLMYVDGCAVICMVYRPIDGEMLDEYASEAIDTLAAEKGIGDMHPGNYRGTPSGRVKVTDIGDIDHGWGLIRIVR